jgi:hypothetical protein
LGLVTGDSEAAPVVSVIVPLHRDGPVFRKCLQALVEMPTEVTFEVIVVSDLPVPRLPRSIVEIATESSNDTPPGAKRDLARSRARAQFLAFIDDDAYPKEDWLDNALSTLAELNVDGVGGPGITPPGSSWRERVGGAVYESRLGSGSLRHRFVSIGRTRLSDDLPAYNFIVRRDALDTIGGWASTFYGGEDTKVCLDLVDSGFRLCYDPTVVVHHHRRPILVPHLRQVANVGRHRGFFVRAYPGTSRRLVFFLPATLSMIVPLLATFFLGRLRRAPLATASTFAVGWCGVAATTFRTNKEAALLFPGVLLCHHLAYGLSFLRGLLGPRITS